MNPDDESSIPAHQHHGNIEATPQGAPLDLAQYGWYSSPVFVEKRRQMKGTAA